MWSLQLFPSVKYETSPWIPKFMFEDVYKMYIKLVWKICIDHIVNRWKFVTMEDDEADLREQIFHNNVREQIVSNIYFGMVSYVTKRLYIFVN